jgi:hypothetical protein
VNLTTITRDQSKSISSIVFLDLHQPLTQWAPGRGSFPGLKQPGSDVDHSPPSITDIQNEELYLCSLYMTSWRAQGKLYLF